MASRNGVLSETIALLPQALQQQLSHLFDDPLVALVAVVNARDQSVLLRLSAAEFHEAPTAFARPAGRRGEHVPLPPASVVDSYILAAASAALPFDGLAPETNVSPSAAVSTSTPQEEDWFIAKFSSKHWDVVACRCTTGGDMEGMHNSSSSSALPRWIMLTFSSRKKLS